jgi:hypothetical protein
LSPTLSIPSPLPTNAVSAEELETGIDIADLVPSSDFAYPQSVTAEISDAIPQSVSAEISEDNDGRRRGIEINSISLNSMRFLPPRGAVFQAARSQPHFVGAISVLQAARPGNASPSSISRWWNEESDEEQEPRYQLQRARRTADASPVVEYHSGRFQSRRLSESEEDEEEYEVKEYEEKEYEEKEYDEEEYEVKEYEEKEYDEEYEEKEYDEEE